MYTQNDDVTESSEASSCYLLDNSTFYANRNPPFTITQYSSQAAQQYNNQQYGSQQYSANYGYGYQQSYQAAGQQQTDPRSNLVNVPNQRHYNQADPRQNRVSSNNNNQNAQRSNYNQGASNYNQPASKASQNHSTSRPASSQGDTRSNRYTQDQRSSRPSTGGDQRQQQHRSSQGSTGYGNQQQRSQPPQSQQTQQRSQPPPTSQSSQPPPPGTQERVLPYSQRQQSSQRSQTQQGNKPPSQTQPSGQVIKIQDKLRKMATNDDMEISDGEEEKPRQGAGWENCDVCGINFSSQQVSTFFETVDNIIYSHP